MLCEIGDMDSSNNGQLVFRLVDIADRSESQWVAADSIMVVNDCWENVDWSGSGVVFNVAVDDKLLCSYPEKIEDKRGVVSIVYTSVYYWATVTDVCYLHCCLVC